LVWRTWVAIIGNVVAVTGAGTAVEVDRGAAVIGIDTFDAASVIDVVAMVTEGDADGGAANAVDSGTICGNNIDDDGRAGGRRCLLPGVG
jgi:hypothetical protein